MKTKINHFSVFVLLITCLFSTHLHANQKAKANKLDTGLESGLYTSDAVFYEAEGKRATVFVPGYIFSKESWTFLAKQFQQSGIASISINGKSADAVKAAVDFLVSKSYSEIYLVGGSMGAAAIMKAMEEDLQAVNKIVLLSPFKGVPVKGKSVDKLFIASSDERGVALIKESYEKSETPKEVKYFSGSKHAQFLFFSEHRKETIGLITRFLND